MPNFSHPRQIVLETLTRNPASTLQNFMRALGIGENYTPAEYLRVHQLMTRLLKAGLISRASNPRHGLTLYSITPEGRNALVVLDAKVSQEMTTRLVRKKRDASGTTDEAPVRLSPVRPAVAAPSSLDVVRCPGCGFLIPANEVRHSLHSTGTAACPQCQYDLSDVVGGRIEE